MISKYPSHTLHRYVVWQQRTRKRVHLQPKPLHSKPLHSWTLHDPVHPLLHTSPLCALSAAGAGSLQFHPLRGGTTMEVGGGGRVHSPTGLCFQLLRAVHSVDGFGLFCSVPSVSGCRAVATRLRRPWSTTATDFRSVYRIGLPVETPLTPS